MLSYFCVVFPSIMAASPHKATTKSLEAQPLFLRMNAKEIHEFLFAVEVGGSGREGRDASEG